MTQKHTPTHYKLKNIIGGYSEIFYADQMIGKINWYHHNGSSKYEYKLSGQEKNCDWHTRKAAFNHAVKVHSEMQLALAKAKGE